MDQGLFALYPFQHDIMVHVPVQNCRNVEIGQLLQRQLDRAGCKADPVRKTNQGLERGTAQAGRKAAAHRAKIDIEAMEIGDHRQ